MINTPQIKFNTKRHNEFFKEVNKRVNNHFIENKISRYANLNMKLKTVFMICLYFIPLAMLYSGLISTFWPMMAIWITMGFGMAGIGLSIMHDANHGAYSKKKTVNNVLGYLVNFLGAYHINWKIQHNVLHHSFTNVEGHDEDIATPVMRFTPNQKRRKIFRYQAFYAPLFYGIMTMYWYVKDFRQLVQYKRRNLLKSQGLSFSKALAQVIFNKVWYLSITLVLPLYILNLYWWQVLIGFVVMQFVCGLLLALIFQPAHVIEETQFYEPDHNGSLENNWAIHQMRTTANFATDSKFFSWFIGGLNHQIEHHLFPNICHIHYKNISKIVRKTASEFNLPYHQHKTFFGALKSHFTLLNKLGTGVV